jgi:alginate O-acetyltransferase complex protein AlgI
LCEDYITLTVTLGLVLLVSATRYLVPELRLTTRPPEPSIVLTALLITSGIVVALWRVLRSWSHIWTAGALLIVIIFVAVKYDPLAAWLSGLMRAARGQDVGLASAADLGWLGFSYVAFRLIHTLRDRQAGQLPVLSLRDYLTYVIFFPAYTAGPLDRAERFVVDYHALPGLDTPRLIEGTGRILIGLFRKFVLADTLALISLNATNAMQTTSAGGLWLLLYAYAFRLFFDFSGYSDIAIGIGILYGVHLPENFDRPYLKNSITAFWQSWHVTLSSWVRFYIFSPLSRWLLSQSWRPPTVIILLTCHLVTMMMIGLWHGITWNFLLWGLWHGLGLFVHKIWSDRTRRWYIRLKQRPRLQQAWAICGVFLTFHYILLGWVWFALPDLDTATLVFARLFGS